MYIEIEFNLYNDSVALWDCTVSVIVSTLCLLRLLESLNVIHR